LFTWVNYGRTPASNVRFCSVEPIFTNAGEDIPANYTSKIIPIPIETFIALGANQPMQSGQAEVDPFILIQLSAREKHLVLVFRIEYNDIFVGTPIRVSQYC
jgi:hypothetical protein